MLTHANAINLLLSRRIINSFCILFFYCKTIFEQMRYTGFEVPYITLRGHRGRDRMLVGFTTPYAISAYHY
jgi:hypothetical protein